MRKQVFGRKLKRDANERKALFKGLINALVMQESINTTEEKAKAIRGQVEKLVTKAKVKKEAALSLLQPFLEPKALKKVMDDLAVRFAQRPGGYTRIVKLGQRFGDGANMVILEWVEKVEAGGKKSENEANEKRTQKFQSALKNSAKEVEATKEEVKSKEKVSSKSPKKTKQPKKTAKKGE